MRFVRYALVLALAAAFAGRDHASAEGFDEAKLKAIPLMEIIRIAAAPYQDGGPQRAADLAPEVRTLVRLAALDTTLYSVDGEPRIYSGNPVFFHRIVAALEDACLPR